jgi:hypothetical protein
MKKAGWPLLLVGLLALAMLIFPTSRQDTGIPPVAGPESADSRGTGTREGLNRNASNLIYSKHARCRMDCRHISEEEVLSVLRTGKINWEKSDMRGQPDPKYALEGDTVDGQRIRVIFANSPRGIVVVTVIDLENEWKCNCR